MIITMHVLVAKVSFYNYGIIRNRRIRTILSARNMRIGDERGSLLKGGERYFGEEDGSGGLMQVNDYGLYVNNDIILKKDRSEKR